MPNRVDDVESVLRRHITLNFDRDGRFDLQPSYMRSRGLRLFCRFFRQDVAKHGGLSIAGHITISESDVNEDLARQCMLTLDSLQAAWRDGYRYGWVLRDAVKFASPPVTYDHTL
jgi:hypothetical protein